MAGAMAVSTCPTKFSELKPALSEATLQVLSGQGFERTTPVQASTIPLFLSNKDVAVEAVTGSGKTLAFVLPIIEMLRKLEAPLKRHQVGAIIISPTRELAQQIHAVAVPFVDTVRGLKAALLVGGTDVGADVRRLKEEGANVLIGTPGRLNDIMERSAAMDLKRLEVLVLDEADRLLDMGFQRQVTAIIHRLPKQRRTGLFSATQTEAVEELARAGMRNPVRVEVKVTASKQQQGEHSKTPASLSIKYLVCEVEEKVPQLVEFLKTRARGQKCIVYFLTCACVDYWATVLPRLKGLKKLPITALHGKMKQSVREKALVDFSQMPAGVLFCTDVAARGLDIPGVDWILQFDPPQDPSSFIHRVGRTARMGREGHAVVYLLPGEDTYVEFLRLRKVPLTEVAKSEGLPSLTEGLREAAAADRDVLEKGTRAMVSFVRGYKEHQCKYIFRYKDLQLGRLAMAFGLLQLPRMPELQNGRGKYKFSTDGFVPAQVDADSVRFKDARREKQRQVNLARRDKERAAMKLQDHVKKEKRKRTEVDKMEKLTKKKRNAEQLAGDSEDLEKEYRLLTKLRKGKISEKEYAQAMGDEVNVNDNTDLMEGSVGDSDGGGEGERQLNRPSDALHRRPSTKRSGKGPSNGHVRAVSKQKRRWKQVQIKLGQ